MPVVLLIGAPDQPATALRAQLHRLGAVVDGPMPAASAAARVAAGGIGAGPVTLLSAATIGHDHALRMLLLDNRADLLVLADTELGAELAASRPGADVAVGLRLSGRAGWLLDQATAASRSADPGAVAGPQAEGSTIAGLAHRLAHDLPAEFTRRTVAPGALVATTSAAAAPLAAQALAAVAAAGGEDRVRVEQSVKKLDNPVAAHLIAPWSKRLARMLVRLRVPPDAITVASLLVALLAAVAAATGTRPGYLVAAVAMLASFGLDCTDGQMARYAVRYSALGAWLDGFGDRVKEQLVLAGLAVGGVHATLAAGHSARQAASLWLLAAAAGAVTLIRHLVAFGYTAAEQLPAAPPVPAGELSHSQRLRFDLRKIAMLPFGERTLLIAVLAALTSPRVVFVALAVLGGLATLAMLAGRARRTWHTRARRFERAGLWAVAALTDAGPLASGLGSMLRRRRRRLLAVPGSLLVAGVPMVVLLALALATDTGSAGHPVRAGVLALVAAAWWLCTGGLLAARPGGWLAWALPAATGFAEAAVLLVSVHTLITTTMLIRTGTLAPVALAGTGFVLLGLVTLHRYDREYALSLTGPRGPDSGREPGPGPRLALGHEARMLAVTVLSLLAVLTRSGLPAQLLWLLAALVAAALVLAGAAEIRTALRLQRARG